MKYTKVEIDGKSLRDYILKSGETLSQAAEAIGISENTLGRYLTIGTMQRVAYICILKHYGIEDEKTFLKAEVEATRQKREDNIAVIAAVDRCYDRLDYINKNLCELLDKLDGMQKAMADFVEAMK